MHKRTILLVAEAVTLAHYARIATLARALPASEYNIVVAADPRFRALDPLSGITFHPLMSVSSSQFTRALEHGAPLYDRPTLIRYVEADLELLDRVKPDLVVGDFRLSLAVSAPLRNTLYASVVNTYWSPYAAVQYPVPDLPFTRLTGVRLGQWLFDRVRPMAFALHARPLQQTRRHFGLAPLPGDLRNVYTWADQTLYADMSELVPTQILPTHHRYLGPVLWSSRTPLPDWWNDLPMDKPIVFVTLGSSGQSECLPKILVALSRQQVTVIAATAGKISLTAIPSNCYVADYLPIDIAVQRASLVICNGGSLSTYQALAHKVPVIGICSNMDQLLNMQAVECWQAGITLRVTNLGTAALSGIVADVLNRPSYAQAASRISHAMTQIDSGQRFREFVAEMLR